MRYRLIFFIIGPFVMWSIYFITLYGVQAIGCEANWDSALVAGVSVLKVILVGILAASALLSTVIFILARRIRPDQGVITRIGRYCAAAGLFSTVIIFPGILWLELC